MNAMFTNAQTQLTAQIREQNRCLECALRSYGVSLMAYKLAKAIVQMLGVAAGIYALNLGADPTFAFVLITGIILGPEGLETVLTSVNEAE